MVARPRFRPMLRARLLPASSALAGVLLLAAPVSGQSLSDGGPFDETLTPLPGAPEAEPLPPLELRLLAAIPLPGPLPGGALRLEDGRVIVPVAGGVAAAAPAAGARATALPDAAVTPFPGEGTWVEDAGGRQRFAVRDGRIVAQRRCGSCRSGFRRIWRARIPGDRLAVPLPQEELVFVGGLDNRVYALRQHNGHRVWTADVGGRISRPLVPWRGSVPATTAGDPPLALDLVLVVPDHGARLLALDAESGRHVASVELDEAEGSLVGVPLTTEDGRIVVARQRYTEQEADLLVYALDAAPDPAVSSLSTADAPPSGASARASGSGRRP